MTILVMVGSLLAVLGYYLFLLPPVTSIARDAPAADVAAATMLVYQKAAIDWCLRTTCRDGAVPGGALILPPGFTIAPWIAAVADGGRVSTFVVGIKVNRLDIATSLGDMTEGGASVGLLSADGTLVGRGTEQPGRVPVVIPGGIPQGTPVVSQKAK